MADRDRFLMADNGRDALAEGLRRVGVSEDEIAELLAENPGPAARERWRAFGERMNAAMRMLTSAGILKAPAGPKPTHPGTGRA